MDARTSTYSFVICLQNQLDCFVQTCFLFWFHFQQFDLFCVRGRRNFRMQMTNAHGIKLKKNTHIHCMLHDHSLDVLYKSDGRFWLVNPDYYARCTGACFDCRFLVSLFRLNFWIFRSCRRSRAKTYSRYWTKVRGRRVRASAMRLRMETNEMEWPK